MNTKLLLLHIKDRDATIARFLRHQAAPTYAKAYSAGSNRANNAIRWYAEDRERLKALCRSHGIDPVAGR